MERHIRRTKGMLVNPLAAMLGTIVVCLILPAQVAMAYYGVSGWVFVRADEAGDAISRSQGGQSTVSLSDEAEAYALPGQSSWAKYSASILSGIMKASLYARNGYGMSGPTGPRWWDAEAGSSVTMKDVLDFNFPEGYYEEDEVVTISVSIHGFQNSFVNYSSEIQYEGRVVGPYGQDSFSFSSGHIHGYKSYNEDFELTVTVVEAGTTITESYLIPCQVQFYLGPFSAGLHYIMPPTWSYADADFYNSMQITSVEVSEDIGWSSESGVFLTAPEPYKADINTNGAVDFPDFAILASNWNQACDIYDPNDDIINLSDLAVLCEYWLVGH